MSTIDRRWWLAVPFVSAIAGTSYVAGALTAGGAFYLMQSEPQTVTVEPKEPPPEPIATASAEDPPLPSEALQLPAADLVEVAVPREFRGLWVATVSNLDFPSRPGLSASELRGEIDRIVARTDALGMNAIVFQVRPEGDALYRSEHEPWSRFLSGKQGRDPGIDPLEHLITKSHEYGIEVHAWFNPYRALSARGAPVDDKHISKWAAKATRPWGKVLWLDPGVPEIREHAIAVVRDVLDSYDIDGIHLDDYFYPYPEGGKSFPDDPSFREYASTGGKLSRDAWRRHNVDTLVEGLSNLVQRQFPQVRFGISPFGIYRPGIPAGVKGLDQVAQLNADPLKWYEAGWVDYLAPQLYWTTKHERQRYDVLLKWWDAKSEADRPLLVGLDITKVGHDPKWTTTEVRTQVDLSRAQQKTAGQIWFRADPILRNSAGLGDLVKELYREPALPSPLARQGSEPPAPPQLSREGAETLVTLPDRKAVRALVVYQETPKGYVAQKVVGAQTEKLNLAQGSWAVSAIDRTGHESLGAHIVIPDEDAVSEGPSK